MFNIRIEALKKKGEFMLAYAKNIIAKNDKFLEDYLQMLEEEKVKEKKPPNHQRELIQKKTLF